MKNEKNPIWRFCRGLSHMRGFTAAVVAAVLLINLLFTWLFGSKHLYIDLTTEPIYTLSDACIDLLEDTIESANENSKGEESVKVDIIFCADPDQLCGNFYMRAVYYTALSMQREFPETIRVSTTNVWENPSSVDPYRTNEYSSIYQSDVIVASGSEFRVYPYRSFYTYNDPETDETPWAYSGEKNFLRGILAVTRADAPICALTRNHGEPFATAEGWEEYSEFVKVLESAGYEVIDIDLSTEEIPPNCRLIITFDPQTDLLSPGNGSDPESYRLSEFLAQAYSYMVFVDADTPRLTNLEEFLSLWGVTINRTDKDAAGADVNATLEIIDPINTLTSGDVIVGQYATAGFGASVLEDMRLKGASPKVVFGNSASLSYSSIYKTTLVLPDDENGLSESVLYGTYSKNEESRAVFDMFTTGSDAYAYARVDGNRLTDAEGNDWVADSYDKQNPYRLMTITRQNRTVGEGQGYTTVNDASSVCVVASTSFASNEMLSSKAYGNTDALLATLRQIGGEVVPVGLKFVTLYNAEIGAENSDLSFNATTWTAVLILIPAVTLTVVGSSVLIKRKLRAG